MGDRNLVRNSNIELFRIIITLFVLIVHLNGYFIGLDTHLFNFYSIWQVIIESLTCIAVNGFIIISGFFGLKHVPHSIWKLYQGLICIYIPLCIASFIYNKTFSVSELFYSFLPFSKYGGYFVNGYLQLIIFAPFFNKYVEKAEKKVVLYSVIGVLFFEFYFDCLIGRGYDYKEGYSFLHFVTLYLIGRLCSIYYVDLKKIQSRYFITLYIICSLLIVLMSLFKVRFTWFYSNPIMILSSMSLFLFFAVRTPSHHKIVNNIASCSLCVYILQISSPFETYLININHFLYNQYSYPVYVLSILCVACSFYLFGYVWNMVKDMATSKIFFNIEEQICSLFKKLF